MTENMESVLVQVLYSVEPTFRLLYNVRYALLYISRPHQQPLKKKFYKLSSDRMFLT